MNSPERRIVRVAREVFEELEELEDAIAVVAQGANDGSVEIVSIEVDLTP